MKTFNKVYPKVRSKAMDKITKAWKSGGPSEETDFIMEWRIDVNGRTIAIPLVLGFNYNAVIDWGDGSSDTITSDSDPNAAHQYALAGDYIIRISGLFEAFKFDGSTSQNYLLRVLNFGSVGWAPTGLAAAFLGSPNLISISGYGDLSAIADISAMCHTCRGLISVDFSDLKSLAPTVVTSLFYECDSLVDVNINTLNMYNVVDMQHMFFGCKSLVYLDINDWRTPGVSTLFQTFRVCDLLETVVIDAWDAINFGTLNSMCFGSPLRTFDMSKWNITSINNMGNFLNSANLYTAIYDATLENWAAQSVKFNIAAVNFGTSQYTPGGVAEAGRDILTGTYNWTILDGGPAPIFDPIEDSPEWELLDLPGPSSAYLIGDTVRMHDGLSDRRVAFGVGVYTDVEVSAVLLYNGSADSKAFPLAVRMAGVDDTVALRAFLNDVQVYDRISGVFTLLYTIPGAAVNISGKVVKLKVVGPTITVTIDGVEYISPTPTAVVAAGRVGMLQRDWLISTSGDDLLSAFAITP